MVFFKCFGFRKLALIPGQYVSHNAFNVNENVIIVSKHTTNRTFAIKDKDIRRHAHCVHFKLPMCVEFPSCTYWTCDQHGHYIRIRNET
jgi:hypothetical protein